jgi:hypothetical protein
MYIFLAGCLEDGLSKDEVEEAIRDYEHRCSQHYQREDYYEEVVFSLTRNTRREIMVILEYEGGQDWWVTQAKEVRATLREQCFERRGRRFR